MEVFIIKGLKTIYLEYFFYVFFFPKSDDVDGQFDKYFEYRVCYNQKKKPQF